jgi:hypothetical protein
MYLEDTHPSFYDTPDPIGLNSCAYLHNHHYKKEDPLFADKFAVHLKENPIFTADDFDELKSFLQGTRGSSHTFGWFLF